MPKTILPKADRAVIAAHEAGMHDSKPRPETCRDCAAEARFEAVGRAAIAVAPEPIKAIARRARVTKNRVTVDIEVPAALALVPPVVDILPPIFDLDPGEPEPEPWSGLVGMDPPAIDGEPTSNATGDLRPGFLYPTREAWMLAAVERMRPWVAETGVPVGPVRISFGWPGGRGSKANVRGQCWMPAAVKDSIPAIFVSPAMEQEQDVTILGIILHEMNHAAGNFGHTGPFAKTAAALGFLKPWTSSENKTEDLTTRLEALAKDLGPLDHASVNGGHGLKGSGPAAPPVQSTRMLKVFCQEDGYTLRTTAKWLAVAVPTCPICDSLMEVETK